MSSETTTLTIPSTPEDLFKMYMNREMPLFPKMHICVDPPTYDELQHIKDCVSKSYSLRIPTRDLESDAVLGIFDIENRHISILSHLIDMCVVPDETYYAKQKCEEPISDKLKDHVVSGPPYNVRDVAAIFSRFPGVEVEIINKEE